MAAVSDVNGFAADKQNFAVITGLVTLVNIAAVATVGKFDIVALMAFALMMHVVLAEFVILASEWKKSQ